MNLKSTISLRVTSSIKKPVAGAQIAGMRRGMVGAARRVQDLQSKKKALAEKIRQRGEYVADTSNGGIRRFVSLTKAQLITCKADLISCKIELKNATLDYSLKKAQFTGAFRLNTSISRQAHKQKRTFVRSIIRAPQLIDEVMEALEDAPANESKDTVEHLMELSQSGSAKEFNAALDAFLSGVNPELLAQVGAERSVKSQIVSEVKSRLKAAPIAPSGGPA